ncbi:MAG: plasmid partitioning protein [Polyangia bacterium]
MTSIPRAPLVLLVLILGAFVAASGGCGALGEPAEASRPGALLASRCQVTADSILCSKRELPLPALLTSRTVHFELPLGTPPLAGWPVVVYFQGSFFAGSRAFAASRDEAFGAYHLTQTVKALLDAGYAVLAPDALLAGSTFWQTNVPPWSLLWTTSSDHALMLSTLRAIGDGRFGPLDPSRLYAMGISSGGFMTSRMAVSYRGRFRALAVHSASYATCSALCLVPPLPDDHPPTLFLHGGLDLIVPVTTMAVYRDALRRDGTEVRTVLDPAAGHQWLPSGPSEIVGWFGAH